jgi:hypothetical protein
MMAFRGVRRIKQNQRIDKSGLKPDRFCRKRVTEIDEVHIWRFNTEGLVQKFRHQVDSWTLAEAVAA